MNNNFMPREKLIRFGKTTVSNEDLISILLSTGNSRKTVQELAKEVLNSVNNQVNLLSKLEVNELTQIHGIGQAKACLLVSAFELAKRSKYDLKISEVIDSSVKSFKVVANKLMFLTHEEFWLLCLSKSNQVLDLIQISKGGIDATYVDVRLLFNKLILNKSSSFIVAHNHPSGILKPSKADIQLTNKIIKGAKIFDIPLLDHLIIGDNSYFSFADNNLIKK
ncbi:MAG: DNA repair protein RadC [Flavobacteriales bacterium]|nr:DNA repair protein RadC [Flavobacteriales bacterium]